MREYVFREIIDPEEMGDEIVSSMPIGHLGKQIVLVQGKLSIQQYCLLIARHLEAIGMI